MSPEQANRQQVDERADIWAFGVLYEILTGERLFKGEDVSELGIAQAPHVPIPVDELALSLFLAHPQITEALMPVASAVLSTAA